MQHKLVISATFSAEPLYTPLRAVSDLVRTSVAVNFAPFNQVIQQLVDPNGLLRKSSGHCVVLVRWSDWLPQFDLATMDNRAHELVSHLSRFADEAKRPLLLLFCPEATASPERSAAINVVEQGVQRELSQLANLMIVTSAELLDLYPTDVIHDPIAAQTASIPYTSSFYAVVAARVARWLNSNVHAPSKVLILDCDHTLWSGVCGEEGPLGIRVTAAHQELQQCALDLRSKGVLLGLCSKNEARDVWDVFEQNPHMLLKREHITTSRINWDAKSLNLRSMANELGLSLASFVMLDDNPVECAELRANCPNILTLQIPTDGTQARFLKHIWALDRSHVTVEDSRRAELYQQEQARQALKAEATSLTSFLADLQLQVDFEELSKGNSARAAQLMQRTSQFNLSGLQLAADELERSSGFVVSVSDKYGDYGIVGAVVYRAAAQFDVTALVLSCRALGRGVEQHMMKHLAECARNYDRVQFAFQPTVRNTPAFTFLQYLAETSTSGNSLAKVSQSVSIDSSALQSLDPLQPIELASEQSSDAGNHVPTTGVNGAPSELMQTIATTLDTAENVQRYVFSQSRPRPSTAEPYVAPANSLEERVVQICEQVLHLRPVGVNDSIKDLGGTSLHIVQIHSRMVRELDVSLTITELYSLPSIQSLVERLNRGAGTTASAAEPRVRKRVQETSKSSAPKGTTDIAVIGLAGQFPGARNAMQFWQNLVEGVNSIVDIDDAQLNLPTNSPLRQNPNLVRKSSSVQDADFFDAKFFQIFPKEARVMDPQHRLLLECAWHALEDAGYTPDAIPVPVGVFAGCYMNTYMLASLESNPRLLESLANSFHGGDLLTELGNDKDYLATRISFLLNLRGPAITVQTACSTSLVAIVQACQSLQAGHCDMALAGGSTLKLPQHRGYLYTEGGMVSPDGMVRTFDANARGTVFGEGCGMVTLKRLADAIADRDDIYSVIKGSGINNDGHAKLGYTAPSVEGQRAAIAMAHRQARISADTISYVEAHGTGTALGDPIEVDALTQAFRETTEKTQFCAIGSLKTNVGHLDVAAGVAGLIKLCLAMKHQAIPPSLNFEKPNPNIDFERSPFFVNTRLRPWLIGELPRRAGLSSFGVGGTNAHIVVEEPPTHPDIPSKRRYHPLVLSGRSEGALQNQCQELASFLETDPNADLADVAYTLACGRKKFNYTAGLVATTTAEAIKILRADTPARPLRAHQVRRKSPVVFMFPGQGSQHVGMADELYAQEPVFAQVVDRCAELLLPHLGFDLRERLLNGPGDSESAVILNQTSVAQPAIFTVSYALAVWLMNLGLAPSRLLGHSVGEFVAATLAGTFTLEDALRIIALRARTMQDLPSGDMLAVRLSEAKLAERLPPSLAIAAINSPSLCVVSGPKSDVATFQQLLESTDVVCRALHTSHAFHSEMMSPAVAPLQEMLGKISLATPRIPIISSVTGVQLPDTQATAPGYWATHLRETVRFSDALATVISSGSEILVEVGPGQVLSTLAKQHPASDAKRSILSLLPHAKQSTSAGEHLIMSTVRIWQAGADLELDRLYQSEERRRRHLPTYPFERQRYWFDEIEVETDDRTNSLAAPGIQPDATVKLAPQQASRIAETPAERIVRQQLQIMRQQLETYRN
ncbi:MAG: HAD-IIIC family phosphatase [Planctomycetales bacterium]|nr:HAD-IIIC family phosphatase [Planctomycetales bacterium]